MVKRFISIDVDCNFSDESDSFGVDRWREATETLLLTEQRRLTKKKVIGDELV